MSVTRAVAALASLLAVVAVPALAIAQKEPSGAELAAGRELDTVRNDPLALHVFLKRMPKGADLHSHLHSAVYAETLIGDAIEDELCIDTSALSFVKPEDRKSVV